MVRKFGAVLVWVVLSSIAVVPTAEAKHRRQQCPTGFANFGDSLTDTGNVDNVFPFTSDSELSPYGETFFGGPAKRFCNGRVVPDFFCECSQPFLNLDQSE